MKMSMVGPGCLGGLGDCGVTGDKDFLEKDVQFDFVDFWDIPMESLAGADDSVGDWDASKSQCLGPIPSDACIGLPPVSFGPPPPVYLGNANRASVRPPPVSQDSDDIASKINAPIGGIAAAQESGSFQTHSPVSVLESSSSNSVGKVLPIKSNDISCDRTRTQRTRSKRARPTPLKNPWLVMSPISSAVSASKKTSSYRKIKEKKKKVSQLSLALKMADDSFQPAEESLLHASDATEYKETSLLRSVAIKRCTHCQVTKTPQWREGPNGPKTLCNACGVRYRSGRLYPEYRPAASPTFVPSLHSNSHKKVIEMREKTMQETTITYDPPMSPSVEFLPMTSHPYDFIY